jgi:hypothetical protein
MRHLTISPEEWKFDLERANYYGALGDDDHGLPHASAAGSRDHDAATSAECASAAGSWPRLTAAVVRQLRHSGQISNGNSASSRDGVDRYQDTFDWSQLNVYGFNRTGHNHGILLGTKGWKPE